MKTTASRRLCLAALLTAALSLLGPALPAQAQDQPVKLLVGFPAGGSLDLVARVLAEGMQRELGRPVVVENKAGAGGQIAAQALKGAAPDGRTLFMSNSHTVAMIPLTMLKPGFDTLKDFDPVAMVAVNPDVFAVSTALVGNAVSNLREYGQWVRAHAGKGSVGVPAPASAPDFAVGLVGKALGVSLQSVPFRGDGPVTQDLVAGQIPAGLGGAGAMLPHAKAGKLRILAVNGSRRSPQMPDVPTYAEQGVDGYEEVIFTGVFAPAGTPRELVAAYNAAINKIVLSAGFAERLSSLGIIPTGGSPADLAERVRKSSQAWQVMVRNAGYQPQ